MQEEWMTIPGFERYQVSNLGAVKSVRYKNSCGREGILVPKLDTKGYAMVRLYKPDKTFVFKKVHRLVMLAFVGCSELQVNHRDGIKTNNSLENLEYCTDQENKDHAIRLRSDNGQTHKRGGSPKLTESQVRTIKQMLKDGMLQSSIATQFNVSPRCIRSINDGVNWKWVR